MFEEYAAKTIGIDFGTNNSVVGVYNTKIEKPLVIENEEGLKSPVDIIKGVCRNERCTPFFRQL